MACLAPNKLADGTEVACRECKLCQLKAKNDWVGRNIAESKTSRFCYVITATYGRGKVGESLHERAVILTPSDVQKFMKLLRRHGYECRVFYTGEYGSERQRAHWNIILYSDKPLPAFSGWDQYGKWTSKARYKQRFNWCRVDSKGQPVKLQNGNPAYWWPHGFVHVDEVSVGNVRYVCKYVLKDFDANGKQGHKGQSKGSIKDGKGPLGTLYFRQLAERYVQQGLAPQTPEYRFAEARTREGEPIRYWLKGRALELFLEHYIGAWAKAHPDRPRPKSDLVDWFEEYGKVVNDENRMLVRQQFPKGEARWSWPSKPVIDREYEKALEEIHAREMATFIEIYARDIKDAEDGEERQRQIGRAEQFFTEQWYAFNHKRGRHWVAGAWRVHASGEGPCGCCEPEELHPDPIRPDEGASPSGGLPADALGKVGRWNRAYPRQAGGGT